MMTKIVMITDRTPCLSMNFRALVRRVYHGHHFIIAICDSDRFYESALQTNNLLRLMPYARDPVNGKKRGIASKTYFI